jgi:hypothetical protein
MPLVLAHILFELLITLLTVSPLILMVFGLGLAIFRWTRIATPFFVLLIPCTLAGIILGLSRVSVSTGDGLLALILHFAIGAVLGFLVGALLAALSWLVHWRWRPNLAPAVPFTLAGGFLGWAYVSLAGDTSLAEVVPHMVFGGSVGYLYGVVFASLYKYLADRKQSDTQLEPTST